jgi:nucleotide-binding universal stress UspA family protein
MRLNEILFPTDFSSLSELAGQIARDMTKQAGARLHVLHVVARDANPSQPAEDLARVSRGMGQGLRVEAALLTGSPARNILAHAREKHIDLIVMSTHGRTGLSREILGSVAESVVRLSPCPVLTVPAGAVKPIDASAAASVPDVVPSRPCLVCGHTSEDLVCEVCRNRIRAEALEAKRGSERPGRRGMPV